MFKISTFLKFMYASTQSLFKMIMQFLYHCNSLHNALNPLTLRHKRHLTWYIKYLTPQTNIPIYYIFLFSWTFYLIFFLNFIAINCMWNFHTSSMYPFKMTLLCACSAAIVASYNLVMLVRVCVDQSNCVLRNVDQLQVFPSI